MKNKLRSVQKNSDIKPLLKTAGFIVNEKQLALDLQMVPYDLWGTLAHVLMLYKQQIISKKHIKLILSALLEIKEEVKSGIFNIDPNKGAQLTLEALIVKKTGDAGYSVHTGRSRNDQIMTTEMLYIRDKILELLDSLDQVCITLLSLAKKHSKTVMPGYTHMQPAKITTFGQWALAYLNGMIRASTTIKHCYETYDASPLGACESYGTSWPLDRKYSADLLGFERVWEIPQDVISSRGFIQLGYLHGMEEISLVASKLAEDLLLFTTFEYNMVNLGDDVAQRMHPITGSSVMAQKKNPDALELIRSSAPQVAGFSSIVSNILSALPMGYNRDSREAKEYIDLGLSKSTEVLEALQSVLDSISVDENRMKQLVITNYSLTTDLADYISQQSGIGYRLIYKIIGQVVDEAIREEKLLSEISAYDIKEKAHLMNIFLNLTDNEIKDILNPQSVIEKRNHIGGSSMRTMSIAIVRSEKEISELRVWVTKKRGKINSAKKKTEQILNKLINASLSDNV